MTQVQMKVCPFCAEAIRTEAILCRYCKSQLSEAAGSPADDKRSAVPPLRPPQAPAMVMPAKKATDATAWCIAFAPLALALAASGTHQAGGMVGASIVVGLVLCILDEHLLKRAGYPTPVVKWGGHNIILFVLISPIYLYHRAKLLQHRQWQLATWIAAFVISLVV